MPLTRIITIRGKHRNFSCNINTFQLYHPLYNINNILVIGRHICTKWLEYVHLGIIMVSKHFSGFHQYWHTCRRYAP